MKRRFQLPEAPGQSAPNLVFDPASPWLAPLAGYSDLPFRLLCREYGAAVCETEMVSAKGLLYRSPGSDTLLQSAISDQPLVVQLFGSEPVTLAQALLLLRRHGFDAFDFNLGCPVRKVMRQGAGAALLAKPDLVLAIAKAMIAAARMRGDNLPDQPAKIGFKFRLPPGNLAATALGQMLEDAGADWLCLHPRTAEAGYGGKASWEEIANLADAVEIPVIASGDLMSAQAGATCLAQTGASCVMYARGSLRDPFIFRQHKAIFAGEAEPLLDKRELIRITSRHIELTSLYYGDRRAFVKIRSIIPRYIKNLKGVGKLRLQLSQCEDWDKLGIIFQQFLEEEPCG